MPIAGCGDRSGTQDNANSCCHNGPWVFPMMTEMHILLIRVERTTKSSHLAAMANTIRCNSQRGENQSPFPYKSFINMNKLIILTTQYYIQPYLVGSDKRSLALILPSKLVKSLNINPMTILFLLKVAGHNELHLKIIRQDDLERKDTEKISAAVVANNQEANNQ